MADGDQDLSENWLTPWEKKCLEEWDKEGAIEERSHSDLERLEQRIWQSFQNSASTISQLYKDGSQQNVHLWIPFQTAAGAATLLYKDSQETLKKSFEHGTAYGSHRRSKELIGWMRKQRRRHLGRDEIIAFLCGRTAPPAQPYVMSKPHRSNSRGGVRFDSNNTTPPRLSVGGAPRGGTGFNFCSEPDLSAFKDAVALQGLSGAMSNVNMGRRNLSSHNSPLRASGSGGATGGTGSPPPSRVNTPEDLHGFLVEQIVRHSRKRPPSVDGRAGSDSPGYKRNRMETDDF